MRKQNMKTQGWAGYQHDPQKYRRKMFKNYNKRNAKLKAMGFPTYQAYLESDLWKSIRARVLDRDSHKCFCCDGKASVVHHCSYTPAGLSGRCLDSMKSLCHACHKEIEFYTDGGKVRLSDARYRLRWVKWKHHKPPVGGEQPTMATTG